MDLDEFKNRIETYVREVSRPKGRVSDYPVKWRLITGIFAKRAQKLFNRELIDIVREDPRFYVHTHSKGGKFVLLTETVNMYRMEGDSDYDFEKAVLFLFNDSLPK